MSKGYGVIALTGGGVGALDSIDGSVLSDGDVAFAVVAAADQIYFYTLDSSSAAAESSPTVISPDTNAGDKRWLLTEIHGKNSFTLYDGTNIGYTQFVTNILELYNSRTSGVVRVSVKDGAGNKETAATFTGGGAVSLYYDNSVKIATSSTGATITGTTVSNNYNDASGYTVPFRKNVLINGDFKIAQRGTAFTSATTPANSDDVYLLDRWNLISDGNDIVDVGQTQAVVPTTGFENSIYLDVETANKKFGIVQFVENNNIYNIKGKTATFSFWAKVSDATKLDNVKAGIISWSGGSDTVTSDIINAWNNENVNPTLSANWTFENTPANLNVSTDWAKYTVSGAIDTASTVNVGVVIWSDVTDTTTGHFLYITGCQLELGAVATDFEYRSFSEELALCQRYYEKSYQHNVAPGTADVLGSVENYLAGLPNATYTAALQVVYKVSKRTTPTVTTYSTVTGATGKLRDVVAGGDINSSQECGGENGVFLLGTATGAATSFNMRCHWVASIEL